jgi:hypothetical protein
VGSKLAGSNVGGCWAGQIVVLFNLACSSEKIVIVVGRRRYIVHTSSLVMVHGVVDSRLVRYLFGPIIHSFIQSFVSGKYRFGAVHCFLLCS